MYYEETSLSFVITEIIDHLSQLPISSMDLHFLAFYKSLKKAWKLISTRALKQLQQKSELLFMYFHLTNHVRNCLLDEITKIVQKTRWSSSLTLLITEKLLIYLSNIYYDLETTIFRGIYFKVMKYLTGCNDFCNGINTCHPRKIHDEWSLNKSSTL